MARCGSVAVVTVEERSGRLHDFAEHRLRSVLYRLGEAIRHPVARPLHLNVSRGPNMYAAAGDNGYNIVLLLHILSVSVGAGTAFVAPLMQSTAREIGGFRSQETTEQVANRFVFPGLLLAGIFGGALVGFADDDLDPTISFDQPWLMAAGILWIACLGLSVAAFPPRWFNVLNLAEERRRVYGVWLHLVLTVQFVVMIWQDALF